jgi:hypothetical protein
MTDPYLINKSSNYFRGVMFLMSADVHTENSGYQ